MEIIIRGASFCHVDRIKHDIHEIEDITRGYHMWQGAAPSLIIMDMIKIMCIGVDVRELHQRDILDRSINLDPRAWAKKYLMAASTSWFVWDLMIRGINDIRFNSILTHTKIQLDLDIAIKVLISIVDVTK